VSEYWLALAIGAGSGGLLLALFARGSDETLADAGYLALVAMLAVYIGARLVTGTFTEAVAEMAIASLVAVIARLAMERWLPAIGLFILAHGTYDAVFGPHTGVAEWYPPLCAGFDWVVGAGLLVILWRRSAQAS
jgi:hypothetical protein